VESTVKILNHLYLPFFFDDVREPDSACRQLIRDKLSPEHLQNAKRFLDLLLSTFEASPDPVSSSLVPEVQREGLPENRCYRAVALYSCDEVALQGVELNDSLPQQAELDGVQRWLVAFDKNGRRHAPGVSYLLVETKPEQLRNKTHHENTASADQSDGDASDNGPPLTKKPSMGPNSGNGKGDGSDRGSEGTSSSVSTQNVMNLASSCTDVQDSLRIRSQVPETSALVLLSEFAALAAPLPTDEKTSCHDEGSAVALSKPIDPSPIAIGAHPTDDRVPEEPPTRHGLTDVVDGPVIVAPLLQSIKPICEVDVSLEEPVQESDHVIEAALEVAYVNLLLLSDEAAKAARLPDQENNNHGEMRDIPASNPTNPSLNAANLCGTDLHDGFVVIATAAAAAAVEAQQADPGKEDSSTLQYHQTEPMSPDSLNKEAPARCSEMTELNAVDRYLQTDAHSTTADDDMCPDVDDDLRSILGNQVSCMSFGGDDDATFAVSPVGGDKVTSVYPTDVTQDGLCMMKTSASSTAVGLQQSCSAAARWFDKLPAEIHDDDEMEASTLFKLDEFRMSWFDGVSLPSTIDDCATPQQNAVDGKESVVSPPTQTKSQLTAPTETDVCFGSIRKPVLQQVSINDKKPAASPRPETELTPVVPTDHDVCFGMKEHPATQKWREAVDRFSAAPEKKWTNAMSDMVKEDLAKQDITRFLVKLPVDHCGVPCRNVPFRPCRNSNEEGLWVLATEQEIREITRQRFRDCLKNCKRSKCVSTDADLHCLQDAISEIESSFELMERTNVWKEPSKAEMSMMTGLTQSVERLQGILEKFGQRHHANPSPRFIETGGMPQDGIKPKVGTISQGGDANDEAKVPLSGKDPGSGTIAATEVA
jgi:hypothetical protein